MPNGWHLGIPKIHVSLSCLGAKSSRHARYEVIVGEDGTVGPIGHRDATVDRDDIGSSSSPAMRITLITQLIRYDAAGCDA